MEKGTIALLSFWVATSARSVRSGGLRKLPPANGVHRDTLVEDSLELTGLVERNIPANAETLKLPPWSSITDQNWTTDAKGLENDVTIVFAESREEQQMMRGDRVRNSIRRHLARIVHGNVSWKLTN